MEYECKKKGCLHQSSSYSSIILATLREHCALAFIDTMDNLVKSDPKMFEISFKSEDFLLSAFILVRGNRDKGQVANSCHVLPYFFGGKYDLIQLHRQITHQNDGISMRN